MRPAWAERGAPNVLSGRGPGALEAITAQAARLGLKIAETAIVTKDGADVTFARCESENAPTITQAIADTTDKITALRVVTTMQREGKLSLMGKMAALTERAQDFTKSTEDVLDSIAAKITTAEAKRDDAASKHNAYYDAIIKGVDDSIAVIDRLSNIPLADDGVKS